MAYFGSSSITKKKTEPKGDDDLYSGFDVGPGLFESELYAADPKRASMVWIFLVIKQILIISWLLDWNETR